MRKLIYSMSVSLDGYINDAKGSLDWVRVDEEYHRFANDLMRETGLSIYGFHMWQTMAFWDGFEHEKAAPDAMSEFAELWKPADKLVVSKRLKQSDMLAGARLMHDGLIDEVKRLKAQPGKPIAVSGATIASSLIDAGLVDEIQPFFVPAILGGGTPFLQAKQQSEYDLTDVHRFKSGMTYQRYEKRS